MLKVLVVDDEKIICDLICALLDWEQYQMEIIGCVYDGEEAFIRILEEGPDVVITDIRMPGMDGLEMIRQAKERRITAKFIILSGYKDFSYAQEAIKLGAADYLLKPVEEEELLNTLLKVQKEEEIYHQNCERESVLYQQLSDSRQKLFQKFLGEMLEKTETSRYETGEITAEWVNEEYGTNFFDGNYVVIEFVWNYLYGLSSEEEKRYMEEKSVRYFKEQLQQTVNCQIVETREHTYALLNSREGGLEEEVDEAFEKTALYISTMSEGTLSGGMGTVAQTIQQLPLIAGEAREACRYRLLNGMGCLNFYPDIEFVSFKAEKILDRQNEKRFQQNIELMEWEVIKAMVRELYGRIPKGADPAIYFQVHQWVMEQFVKGMAYLDMEVEDLKQFAEEKGREIRRCGQLEQLIRKTDQHLEDVIQICREQSDYKDSRLVNISKEYIRKNHQRDIRLADVAGQVFLSPTYFSMIFKRETGMNFNEFLIECRIESAKELLKNMEYSIIDVGEKVGYEDSKYFSKLFRKLVGVSPRDYRKLYFRKK